MTALEVELQGTIETIYRLNRAPSVADFRIGSELLERFLGEGASDLHRETLVVRESEDVLDLALFISDEVVERARAFAMSPDRPHLDAFCVATEGVSHFVYVTFCTEQDRSVSPIEMEVQAEVDKYLVVRLLFPGLVDGLVTELFDRFRLAPRLSVAESERYTVANRAGRRYARWLHREFGRGRGERAMRDARLLYRKPLAAKLEHISQSA